MLAKFAADTSNFAKGVNEMQSQLRNLESGTQSMSQKMSTNFVAVGKALTLGLSTPLLTMAGVAVKSGMSLETAMTGVAKTTDMAGSELESFKKDLQDMAGQIPVATTELAEIAETAGQLGIKKEHLLGFTRTMADLGVATNLSSEEAATSLARLANITQMPQTEFDRLGSVVVELGNNLATTEKEIVEMSLRLAGTGKQVGLTEAEIMGLSGAMSSVGISAQAGGSAMSKAMQIINSEVLSGGENVKGFADVAGMSAEQFSDTWKNDPIAALDAFIGGLGEVSESGGDVAGTLEGLGIKNMNMIDTLSRLTGASGLMTESVDMANRAWDENTALTDEAETAYDTVANKLVILGNKVMTFAQRVGDILLPMVADVIDKVTGWIDKLSELDDSTLETIVKIGAFVAAVGPVLLVIGKLIPLVVSVAGFISKLVFAFTAVAGGAATFGEAMLFIMGPVGWVIAGITALIAIGVLLWKNWDEISAKASEIWGAIKEYLSATMESISTFFSEKWESVKTHTMAVWESISSFFTETIPQIIENITEWFGQLPTRLQEKWNQVIEGVKNWATRMKEKATEVGTRFLEIIVNFFTDLPYKVGYFIGNTLAKVVIWAVDMWNKAKETGRNFVSGVGDFISKLPERIWGYLTDLYNRATTWASNMWTKAKETGSNFYNAVSDYISQLPSRIYNYLTDVYSRATTWASQMWSKAKETGSNFITGVITYLSQLPGRVMTWLSNVISRATTWATNMGNKGRQAGQDLMNKTISALAGLPGKMAKAGADVVKGFWNGIKNLGGWIKGKVKGFFNGIVDGVKGALKIQSPSKVFEQFGEYVDEGFIQGIDKGARDVNKSMSNMIDGAVSIAEKTNVIPVDFSTGMVGNVQRALDNSIDVRTPTISDQTITHELSSYGNDKPMELNLVIGGKSFRAYVENISEQQGQEIDLELEF